MLFSATPSVSAGDPMQQAQAPAGCNRLESLHVSAWPQTCSFTDELWERYVEAANLTSSVRISARAHGLLRQISDEDGESMRVILERELNRIGVKIRTGG